MTYPTVETLFRQASMTANTYFHEAIDIIDKKFGNYYAQEHPELIGALMQTAALDFQAGIIATAIKEAANTIGLELHDMSEALDERARTKSDPGA